MFHPYSILIAGIQSFQVSTAGVLIHHLRGDVQVRRGLEEKWSEAAAGMELKAMDTIFSGEASEVVLLLEEGVLFTLGGHSILDISDLRRISERQLFLYLMSQKVGHLNISEPPDKIHIENVSVVRGERKGAADDFSSPDRTRDWMLETNGAKALFNAAYRTNAIMKFYKILERYPTVDDQGEIHFYLGRAFESLEENGRACDAFETALNRMNGKTLSGADAARKASVQEALARLKSLAP